MVGWRRISESIAEAYDKARTDAERKGVLPLGGGVRSASRVDHVLAVASGEPPTGAGD